MAEGCPESALRGGRRTVPEIPSRSYLGTDFHVVIAVLDTVRESTRETVAPVRIDFAAAPRRPSLEKDIFL